MKKWLLGRFLPMWAKETVMKDNRRLLRKLRQLELENKGLRCYIQGIHRALRHRPEKKEET